MGLNVLRCLADVLGAPLSPLPLSVFVSAEASERTSGHPVFTSVVVLEAVYQAGSKGHRVQEL